MARCLEVRGSNPPWSVLGLGFNERVLGFAWYSTSVCFLLVVGEKGVSQKKSVL